MTNKMVGRVLTYELGSWSYGDLKLKSRKNFKTIFKPGVWHAGFLNAAKNAPGTNGE